MRDRPPTNDVESYAWTMLKQDGFTPQTRGWPDFLVESPDGRVLAIECKSGYTHKIKWDQMRAMELLERAGVPCFVYCPHFGAIRYHDCWEDPETGRRYASNVDPDSINEQPWSQKRRSEEEHHES